MTEHIAISEEDRMSSGDTLAPLSRGLWGVLATPFTGPELAVDAESLRRQVQLHRRAGSHGLVVLGVFGESAQLSAPERVRVVATVRAESDTMPIVIGIAERARDAAIASASQLLAQAPGATIMLQVPSADPKRVIDFLRGVHLATGAGVVVQDYPAISGVTIRTRDLVDVVSQCAFVVAVKSESPPTSAAIAILADRVQPPVFGGLGGLGLLDELMSGAAGAMTGFSHPEALRTTVDAWFDRGYTAAREAFLPWLPLVNFEAQPAVGLAIRKESLTRRGVFSSGAVRPPAAPLPEALRPLLIRHLAAIQDLATVHRLPHTAAVFLRS